MADKILGFAVKGIAGGIGLATEAHSARKEKKKLKKGGESASPVTTPPANEPSEERQILEEKEILEQADEKQWELDEAQDELVRHTSTENEPPADANNLTDKFILRCPPPAYTESAGLPRLPYPVILPQRRPKDRSRGFIRAYAPILENSGIDQALFLDFLNTFNKATLASPWINAINLAGFAFMALPTAISMAASIALTIATKTAMELQSRARTSSFLDKINNEFFRPRGLYCLVMTWNPDSMEVHQQVDVNAKIFNSLTPTSSNLGKISSKFRSSDGNTYGNDQLMEAAPLIFPELDELAEQTGEEAVKTRDKIKKAGAFVDDYWDRRAQAKYAAKNPDNVLAYEPKKKFSSRYADPNHPASSGNLVSLITGGHINWPPRDPRGGGFGRGFGGGFGGRGLGGGLGGRGLGGRGFGGQNYEQPGMQQGMYDARGMPMYDSHGMPVYDSRGMPMYDERGMGIGMGRGYGPHQQRGGLGGGIGGIGPGLAVEGVMKLLKGKVLYLMIVNMPTDEEMAEAEAAMAAAKKHQA